MNTTAEITELGHRWAKAECAGDVAIAIGKQTQEAAYQGHPSNGEFRVSHVFARKPDGWRLIGMHLSQAAPPPRP